MQIWEIGLAAALPVGVIVVGIVVLLNHFRHRHEQGNPQAHEAMEKARQDYNAGIRMLKESSFEPRMRPHSSNKVASLSQHYQPPLQQAFNWREHPSLISEAVEHGWLSFGFTKTCIPFGSSPTNILGFYSRFSHRRGVDPEILWEEGSGVEYVQRIRLNPGVPMKKKGIFLPKVQSLQCALPLPGPPLGDLSFPQEAYFEITILGENGEVKEVGRQGSSKTSKRVVEDDDIQLISHPANSEDHLVHIGSSEVKPSSFGINYKGGIGKKSPNSSSKDSHFRLSGMDVAGVPRVMSVGLAVGGSALYRLPGSDPGSVGFHSTGYVFLNGMTYRNDKQEENKPDSEARSWGVVNTVIGCGFDPGNKKVFFTLNGKLVYSLNCNSEEFSHPLYPTIATNYDVTVLANFGQNQFEYLPANEKRVVNPCFRRPLLSSSVKWPSKYVAEDSGDLFSMGRIDSQWIENLEVNSAQNLEHRYPPSEAESELFEITLDGNGK